MSESERLLASEEAYRHWTTVSIRFSDEDRMGHVNNAVYAVWFEASRVRFIEQYVPINAELDTVLARITINFLEETRFPGDVRVGARLTAVGNKSLRSGYGIFRDGTCLATAECVNVFFDPRTRRSTAPPEAVRRALLHALPPEETA